MRRYLIIPLLLLIFSGCVSQEERDLDVIEKDLQTSEQSQNANWEKQKTNYENLQTRLTKLSSSTDASVREKAGSLLAAVKDRLKRVYEEIDYSELNEAEQNVSFANSYEEAIQKHQDLLILFNNFEKKYPSTSKPISEGKVRIKSSLESTYNEKYEYNQLSAQFKDTYTFAEASAGLISISAFLQKHPNSIMSGRLVQECDGMRVVKAKLWAQDIKSITSLNTAIEEVKKLLTEAASSNTRNFMQSLITSLDAKRSDVFKVEVAEKGTSLMNSMRSAAVDSAKKQHPICARANDPASIVGEQRNTTGTRMEISRSYVVRTLGDTFCSSTYLVRVDVVGYLAGDENVGVSYGIASSRTIIDARSPF